MLRRIMSGATAIALAVALLGVSIAVASPQDPCAGSLKVFCDWIAETDQNMADLEARIADLESSTTATVAPTTTTVAPTTTTTAPATTTTTVAPTTTTAPSTTTTTVAPTTTTTLPVTTTTVQSNPDYPGQPDTGTMYWGAAVTNQSQSLIHERHEVPTGETVGMNRSFFQWSHIASGYINGFITQDIADGRVPWISVKTPRWAEVANGQHDTQLDALLVMLDSKNSPIWLTVWHEPENDLSQGTPAEHVAMNRHVRERMTTLGINNVALAPILMGWTFDTGSGRNPDSWWAPGIYDFVGVDPYASALDEPVYSRIETWIRARNTRLSIGEWGYTIGENNAPTSWTATDIAVFYERSIAGGITDALLVWDCNQNGYSYELVGGQLTAFHDLMSDSRTFR